MGEPAWKGETNESSADRASNAAEETDLPLDAFPQECPYGLDDMSERPFAADPPKW